MYLEKTFKKNNSLLNTASINFLPITSKRFMQHLPKGSPYHPRPWYMESSSSMRSSMRPNVIQSPEIANNLSSSHQPAENFHVETTSSNYYSFNPMSSNPTHVEPNSRYRMIDDISSTVNNPLNSVSEFKPDQFDYTKAYKSIAYKGAHIPHPPQMRMVSGDNMKLDSSASVISFTDSSHDTGLRKHIQQTSPTSKTYSAPRSKIHNLSAIHTKQTSPTSSVVQTESTVMLKAGHHNIGMTHKINIRNGYNILFHDVKLNGKPKINELIADTSKPSIHIVDNELKPQLAFSLSKRLNITTKNSVSNLFSKTPSLGNDLSFNWSNLEYAPGRRLKDFFQSLGIQTGNGAPIIQIADPANASKREEPFLIPEQWVVDSGLYPQGALDTSLDNVAELNLWINHRSGTSYTNLLLTLPADVVPLTQWDMLIRDGHGPRKDVTSIINYYDYWVLPPTESKAKLCHAFSLTNYDLTRIKPEWAYPHTNLNPSTCVIVPRFLFDHPHTNSNPSRNDLCTKVEHLFERSFSGGTKSDMCLPPFLWYTANFNNTASFPGKDVTSSSNEIRTRFSTHVVQHNVNNFFNFYEIGGNHKTSISNTNANLWEPHDFICMSFNSFVKHTFLIYQLPKLISYISNTPERSLYADSASDPYKGLLKYWKLLQEYHYSCNKSPHGHSLWIKQYSCYLSSGKNFPIESLFKNFNDQLRNIYTLKDEPWGVKPKNKIFPQDEYGFADREFIRATYFKDSYPSSDFISHSVRLDTHYFFREILICDTTLIPRVLVINQSAEFEGGDIPWIACAVVPDNYPFCSSQGDAYLFDTANLLPTKSVANGLFIVPSGGVVPAFCHDNQFLYTPYGEDSWLVPFYQVMKDVFQLQRIGKAFYDFRRKLVESINDTVENSSIVIDSDNKTFSVLEKNSAVQEDEVTAGFMTRTQGKNLGTDGWTCIPKQISVSLPTNHLNYWEYDRKLIATNNIKIPKIPKISEGDGVDLNNVGLGTGV